ncbi:MAG: hypothetical protein ACYCW6_04535 [Candidatus Xenobia bacterium]
MMFVLIVLMAVLCVVMLGAFYMLQFRAAGIEARTLNQLNHALIDEESRRKIHRMEKQHLVVE